MSVRPWLGSSFTDLRAQGAFLISASMDFDGHVQEIQVLSAKGNPFMWLESNSTIPHVFMLRQDGKTNVQIEQVLPQQAGVFIEANESLWTFNTTTNAKYVISYINGLVSTGKSNVLPTATM